MAECGISNLAVCLPQKMFEYFVSLLNQSLEPMSYWIRGLLTESINISLYSGIWAVMVYALSMFYGLLIIYAGFNFMVSGYDSAKREYAKSWFRNILIMIVLVQASYFIYGLVIDLGSLLTAGVLSLVDENFFLLAADNFVSFGLELVLILPYVLVILLTALMLLIRYIMVALGVALFPIGIFLYFVLPLRGYGKLLLNIIGVSIFITFFDALVLLICSRLLDMAFFENMKILVTFSAFLLVDILMLLGFLFVVFRSSIRIVKSVK